MKIPLVRIRLPRLVGIFLVGAFLASALAAEKLDLERVTPVPADQPIPVVDFFRPLLLQEPRLNPSGSHIAAIVTCGEDRHQLLVYELKTQKVEITGGTVEKDIYNVSWLDDHRLVFNIAEQKKYGLGLFARDISSSNDGYPLFEYYGSSLLSVPPKNRLHPLVWNHYDAIDGTGDLGVAVINTDNHPGKFLDSRIGLVEVARENNERHIDFNYPVPPGGITYRYLTDQEGQLAYAFTMLDGRLTMHRLVERKWVRCPVDLDDIGVVDCGDQPGQVVVCGPRQDGKPKAFQYMDASTGQLGEVLMQDKAYDFDGWPYRDPVNHTILGIIGRRNGPVSMWFNEDYRNLQKVLNGFFPGMVVQIMGSDEAQNLFLVATFSDRQPAIYSWVDLAKHTAGLLKNCAPWIDPQRMQPQNIIKFKTRDGRQLDAYLTLPAGATKTNRPPLVVLPHGGPWARDTWGFDCEAQFLASRGYAVLQPNYRGSTGYDWMFPEEDQWDFRKMHDDVTDATNTMIASGLIDKERIAIAGGSFGGYLAVSGVVNEPSLYRCAVTIAGVFDWEQQIKDKKYNQYNSPVYGRLMRKLGDAKKQPEKFDAISPGRHADRIRVPVFVAGGKDDYTVEIEQSRALISALKKYHVPHETLIVREEGHGMSHLSNRVELYTRILAFLDKYVKPAQPVAAKP